MEQQVATVATNAFKLAVFRIAYCLVLLLEVKQIFFFRSLIFSDSSFISLSLLTDLMLLWGAVLLLLLVGWFTRMAAILNYTLSVFIIWQMPAFKYHLDFIMTSVNFLLLFFPVSVRLSVDEYRTRNSEEQQQYRISNFNVWLLVVLGLGLVYFDSAIQKLDSPMWRQGWGFWVPSSMPVNVITNLSWLLNYKAIAQVIGYGVLVFEIAFIFLIWFRPFRWILVITGIGLHVGIAILYPIPHFALLMLTLYIPLLPESIWEKLKRRYQNLAYSASAISKTNEAKPVRAGIGKRTAFILIAYFCLGQLMCITVAPIISKGLQNTLVEKFLTSVQYGFRPFYFINQKFLGIVSHDIFLDKHFAGYNYIVNIRYLGKNGQTIWLPLYKKTGQPTGYNSGRIWTKWAYRITGPQTEAESFEEGVRSFTAFWAQQNNIALDNARFEIWLKKMADTQNWKQDFLTTQMQQPWKKAGWAQWQNNQMELQVIYFQPNKIMR